MITCGICHKRAELGGCIGSLDTCSTCYNEYGVAKARADAAEVFNVALTNEIETDERLKVARAHLETVEKRLQAAEKVLRGSPPHWNLYLQAQGQEEPEPAAEE